MNDCELLKSYQAQVNEQLNTMTSAKQIELLQLCLPDSEGAFPYEERNPLTNRVLIQDAVDNGIIKLAALFS